MGPQDLCARMASTNRISERASPTVWLMRLVHALRELRALFWAGDCGLWAAMTERACGEKRIVP